MKKFNESMLESGERIVVAFKAPWCEPCNKLTPILEKVSLYHTEIFEVNIDDHREMAKGYGIKTIPALIIFEDSKVKEIITGISDEAYTEVTMRLT